MANEGYINAHSICELFYQIVAQNEGILITVILDNARYQKCELVQNLAQELGIELVYLPSYSPHLNLIERLWKFVKKKCLYSKYYSNFTEFKNEIRNTLANLEDCKEETQTLLTLNFKTFKNVKTITV